LAGKTLTLTVGAFDAESQIDHFPSLSIQAEAPIEVCHEGTFLPLTVRITKMIFDAQLQMVVVFVGGPCALVKSFLLTLPIA
jgi:hypothetical protein